LAQPLAPWLPAGRRLALRGAAVVRRVPLPRLPCPWGLGGGFVPVSCSGLSLPPSASGSERTRTATSTLRKWIAITL
jgi:hypothetical protein